MSATSALRSVALESPDGDSTAEWVAHTGAHTEFYKSPTAAAVEEKVTRSPGDLVEKAESAIQAARQQLKESVSRTGAPQTSCALPVTIFLEIRGTPGGDLDTSNDELLILEDLSESNGKYPAIGTHPSGSQAVVQPPAQFAAFLQARSPSNETAEPSNLGELSPNRIPYALTGLESQEALGGARRAASLVSKLTTGSVVEQAAAAEALLQALKEHGDPVRQATHLAGGTHMLQQTMLSSKNERLQDVCVEALAELCQYQPALSEVAHGGGDTTGCLVERTLKGITAGKVSHKQLFVALTVSDSEEVKAACANLKAVRTFAEQISREMNPEGTKESRAASLDAIDAMCTADPGSNLRKLAWTGSLPTLVSSIRHPETPPPQRAISLRLLLKALAQDSRYADMLCTFEVINALAELIADADYPVEVQAGAASVLTHVAAIPSKKAETTAALTDCALPRACEVLHNAGKFWESGPPVESPASIKRLAQMIIDGGTAFYGKEAIEAQLQSACAALVAHLATGSPLCCHVILFHTQVLKTLVSVLVGSHQYLLAESLLRAAGRYAANPQC